MSPNRRLLHCVGVRRVKVFQPLDPLPCADFAAIESPLRWEGACECCKRDLWSNDGRVSRWVCGECEKLFQR